jgi:hypothetical protein
MSCLAVRPLRAFVRLAAVAVALAAMIAGPAQAGGAFLPPLEYPPVVEQGQTFTLSGVECFGQVIGGLDGPGDRDWADVDQAANGSWSVQLTVPLDAEVDVYEWDIECDFAAGGDEFYPFDELEIVEAGTLPTVTEPPLPPPSTGEVPDGTSTSSTSPSASAAARAAQARPTFTG